MRKSTRLNGIREALWRIVAIGIAIAVLATACTGGKEEATTVVGEITVTFDGDKCVYGGPDSVPEGRVTVILDVEDQTDHEQYGLAIVTLDEGRSFEDLDAWSSTGQPVWTRVLGLFEEIPQGSRVEKTVFADKGPLFVVCFTANPLTKAGVLGPIQVGE